jgi:hypothetical protein
MSAPLEHEDGALQEEWRSIPGLEGYEASSLGRIRSTDRLVPYSDGRIRTHPGVTLKPAVHRTGHLLVGVGNRTWRVHRLVALAFFGDSNLPVCHKNDIPTDNRVENLYYGTYSENLHDSVRNGRHAGPKKTHCPRGHEYTPQNTYLCGKYRTSRRCRTCAVAQATARNKRIGNAEKRDRRRARRDSAA